MKLPTYVLITPARNEAALIESTIKSMVAQTVRPAKWVIVSDGSTDGTDDIVKKYAADHEWIELLRMPERRERNFAGKATAFAAGYAVLKDLEFDIVGNLDADITFDEDYFSFLMGKFAGNPRLGVGGTPYQEGHSKYDNRAVNTNHVSGACQMFRRECFEAIGGYPRVKTGGIDLIALLSAQALGWQTKTFTEKVSTHHRKMGSAHHSGFRERWHRGRMDYLLGSHPLWEIFRGLYQMRNKPYVAGGIWILVGYAWTCLSGAERTMPKHLVKIRRNEQMSRLKGVFRRALLREAPIE